MTQDYLQEHPDAETSLRAVEKLTAKAIMDAAKAGDAVATACVDIAAEALGVCCVNLCRVLDPELIVFSGGLALAGDFLLDKIKERFRHFHWTIQEPSCELAISESGEKAGMIGAAAVARMDYMKWSDCWNKQRTTRTERGACRRELRRNEQHTESLRSSCSSPRCEEARESIRCRNRRCLGNSRRAGLRW